MARDYAARLDENAQPVPAQIIPSQRNDLSGGTLHKFWLNRRPVAALRPLASPLQDFSQAWVRSVSKDATAWKPHLDF
jgi:hypothetical protein